ncbi:MAG: DUF4159 domain-containing protein [Planctomycetota bacterium]
MAISAKVLSVTALMGAFCVSELALAMSENDYFKPLGRPPEAQRKFIKGGEGFPPLPLPATPLRRSERKREPQPAPLIGKVIWGASASFTSEDGNTMQIHDWNLAPADCQQLLKKSANLLQLNYTHVDLNLDTFSGNPAEIPVLFFSGGRTLKLTDNQIELLRKYVRSGGMIWMDSVAGSPFFYNGCIEALKKAFPEESLRRIPLDHPIFHIVTDVEKAKLPEAAKCNEPLLEGIYSGCRLGVVVSRYGLGCGWDNFTPDISIKQALYYNVHDATALGLNMLAYAVGYADVGKAHAQPELFGTDDMKTTTNSFVFAQVKHNGVWNTDPGGPGNLLRTLAQDTHVKVTFRRKTVDLASDDLKDAQFLYLSGCHDLTLAPAAVDALRGFLSRGGTLLIDNCQGLKTFDIAVRRELKKVLPQSELKLIAPTHEIFSAYNKISKVAYTPAVQRLNPKLNTPQLEGLSMDGGDLRVIYSQYGLGSGWQGDEHPQGRDYAASDALRLGVNIVTYAMTH